MKDSALSVYSAVVAWTLASMLSTLPVSANCGPLKLAGLSGGACQTRPTAPVSRFSELENFQPAQPAVSSPASYGKLL